MHIMHYAHIHTARITSAVIEKLHELGCDLPQYGEVSQKAVQLLVAELLHPDSCLVDILEENYNDITGKFGCPFSVEESLILAGAFNACPMDQFVDGDVSLDRAVEICFSQTFYDALVEQFGEPEAEEAEEKKPELKVVKN